MEKQSMPSEGQLDWSIGGTCSCSVSRGISTQFFAIVKVCVQLRSNCSLQLQISFEQLCAVVNQFWTVLCSCESLCAIAKKLFFATENQFWTIVCSCEAVKVIGDHSSESNARLATGIPAKTLPHRSPLVTHGSRPMRAQCWASLRSHWSSLTPLPRAVITWLEDTCCVSLWVRISSRHLASFTNSEPLSKLYQSCLKIDAFTTSIHLFLAFVVW